MLRSFPSVAGTSERVVFVFGSTHPFLCGSVEVLRRQKQSACEFYSANFSCRALQSKLQSMDINALLASPESKTLEFKRDLSSPEGVIRTVVAFANTAGGTIVIGVEDGTRRVRGVADP